MKQAARIITTVLCTLAGTAAGAGAVGRTMGKAAAKAEKMSEKHLALYLMMNQWVKVKQEGKNLSEYFERNGYRRIAVYGMSYAGETLVEELEGTGTEVSYGIDQRAESLYVNLEVVTMEEELKEVDAVVVTAVTYYEEIAEQLGERVSCPVLSLEDILYEV